MLDLLLTSLLLLPYRASKAEVKFHEALVLNDYREFYDHFEATGYRDRDSLRRLNKYTRYSMQILFWQSNKIWREVCLFRYRAWHLKKRVTSLENVRKVLIAPY
jgi:hypothetical protein